MVRAVFWYWIKIICHIWQTTGKSGSSMRWENIIVFIKRNYLKLLITFADAEKEMKEFDKKKKAVNE